MIALENKASKGRNGGRTIPINRDLKAALEAYQPIALRKPGDHVITTERAPKMSPGGVAMWF